MSEKHELSSTVSQLQPLLGNKYASLAAERCVKAMARRAHRKTHIVGDKRLLSMDSLHGYHSLDTVIGETLEFVRNINPTWTVELIRFETVAKKMQAIPPLDPAVRKTKPKKDWTKRYVTHEIMIIPELKFTTYIALDDSYLDYVDTTGADLTNTCERFFRNAELESPIRTDLMKKSIQKKFKEAREATKQVRHEQDHLVVMQKMRRYLKKMR